MPRFLRDKLNELVNNYNSEMKSIREYETNSRRSGQYTEAYIRQTAADRKKELQNKSLQNAKEILTAIPKAIEENESSKIKVLFPMLTNNSELLASKNLTGELQFQDGLRTAREFKNSDRPNKSELLVNELAKATMMKRIDYISAVLENIDLPFNITTNDYNILQEWGKGSKQLFEFRNQFYKQTNAVEYVEKIDLAKNVEDKTKRFIGDAYAGFDQIYLPEKNSSDGSDNIHYADQIIRVESLPQNILNN